MAPRSRRGSTTRTSASTGGRLTRGCVWPGTRAAAIPPGFSDESGDFGTFNARLTYAPADGRWEVSLFGTNLTDEYQLNSGFFHGIWGYDFATVARPREIGGTLTFRF